MNAGQTAALIGCNEHDIPIGIRAGVFRPLGRGRLANNSVKYFATSEILRIGEDVQLLNKLTIAIADYWKHKNARRSGQQVRDAA